MVQMVGARGIWRFGGWRVGGYYGLMWSRKVLSRTGEGTRLERCRDFDRWQGSQSRRGKQNMQRPGCVNKHGILRGHPGEKWGQPGRP